MSGGTRSPPPSARGTPTSSTRRPRRVSACCRCRTPGSGSRSAAGCRPTSPLTWDPDASRVHAELVRLADAWVVVDDGLSRNGTFVNGER